MRQPVALVYSAAKLIMETIRKFYLTEQLRILCETYPPPPLILSAGPRYDPSLGTKIYATVSGALAYNDPQTGKVYHIVINQAIHIPHLDHHLLCPMQCQVDDVTVDKTPNVLARDPTDHTHALTVKDPPIPHRQSFTHWPYEA